MKRYFKVKTILPTLFTICFLFSYITQFVISIINVKNSIEVGDSMYLAYGIASLVLNLILFGLGIAFIVKLFIVREMSYSISGCIMLIGASLLVDAAGNVLTFFVLNSEMDGNTGLIYDYLIPAVLYVLLGFGWLSFIFFGDRYSRKRSVMLSCLLTFFFIGAQFVSSLISHALWNVSLNYILYVISMVILFIMSKYKEPY